ncbi:hypothetical protein [Nibrella viscosa]|uniref:hypothetical protein n=1 Tax=Nibrella viscosa TaxID=1084524 RepID=UPI0031EB728F
MRRILVASLLLSGLPTLAQTEKGRGLLTGSINLTYTHLEQGTQSTLSGRAPALTIALSKGWFVRDNFLFGVSASSRSQWNHSNTINTLVSATPAYQYFSGITPTGSTPLCESTGAGSNGGYLRAEELALPIPDPTCLVNPLRGSPVPAIIT